MARGTAKSQAGQRSAKVTKVRLLLDSHIDKAVVSALRRICPAADVAHLADWHGGRFRTAEDAVILAACVQDGRVFVTYDQRTIPGLLRLWAEERRAHAGVFFADSDTVPPDRPGAVAEAVRLLVEELSGRDTTNVVRYLRPHRT